MDTVFLRNLSIRGKHGVGDAERAVEQEFLIDIEASFDTRAAAASDRIDDTVNYSEFRSIARDVVEHNSYYLIEKMAEIIAERILKDVRVGKVRVQIQKPSVYPDAVPGILIERSRI